MTDHHVKSWPENFIPISLNLNDFDLRRDDRSYQPGDTVHFEEFRPGSNEYTGRTATRRIAAIVRNVDGLSSGYCILSLVV